MNENKNTFEPPVLTVLDNVFDHDAVGSSKVVATWSIGEIPDINSK